jgi:hypothetical protein
LVSSLLDEHHQSLQKTNKTGGKRPAGNLYQAWSTDFC